MGITHRFASAIVAPLFAMLLGDSALGQLQSRDQQKCINALNKDVCKVAAAQGKENSGCVRAGTRGTASPLCLTADSKGKVGNAADKTTAHELNNGCLGANAPDFGYAPAGAGNAAAMVEERKLFEDTYGTSDPTAVISTTRVDGNCQFKVTKALEKLIAAKWKVYVKCKKAALRNGAISAAALEACLAAVPSDAKVQAKLSKLDAACTDNCGPPVVISTLFPGNCAGETPATLGLCLEQRAECRICQALNIADDLLVDCDLFDDGVANGSCSSAVQMCGGLQRRTPYNCAISLHVAAVPVPLIFNTSGALDFAASGSGIVAADCTIQNMNPINIPAIGFVCVSPGPLCTAGSGWCDNGPGPALGVDWTSYGNAGPCASNAACTSLCAVPCGAANVVVGECTGYCSGSTVQTCAQDADCAGTSNGSCNGPDLGPSNICQCHCINTAAHGASDPGDLQCNLGATVQVEAASPCDGTDVTIDVGNLCIPFSTQRATASIIDANFVAASVVPQFPNDRRAVRACRMPTVVVGVVNSFGSALGDVSVGITLPVVAAG